MLILLILIYFSIVGGLFFKLFISAPSKQVLVKEPVVEPVQELAKEFEQEPAIPKFISKEAANAHVG